MSRLLQSRQSVGRAILASLPDHQAAELVACLVEIARAHAPYGMALADDDGPRRIVAKAADGTPIRGSYDCLDVTPHVGRKIAAAVNCDDGDDDDGDDGTILAMARVVGTMAAGGLARVELVDGPHAGSSWAIDPDCIPTGEAFRVRYHPDDQIVTPVDDDDDDAGEHWCDGCETTTRHHHCATGDRGCAHCNHCGESPGVDADG